MIKCKVCAILGTICQTFGQKKARINFFFLGLILKIKILNFNFITLLELSEQQNENTLGYKHDQGKLNSLV